MSLPWLGKKQASQHHDLGTENFYLGSSTLTSLGPKRCQAETKPKSGCGQGEDQPTDADV